MQKHSFNKNTIVHDELNHIYHLFNQAIEFPFLNVVWQCECHCGLVIHHLDGKMNLWLTYDEKQSKYILYCSRPEESFRGEAFQYKCLIEIYNYICDSNRLFPEEAIDVELSIDPMQYYY